MMKKMHTMSMESHTNDAGAAPSGLDGNNRDVVVPAPPPYTVALEHPIIAQYYVTTDVERQLTGEDAGDATLTSSATETSEENSHTYMGDAFPVNTYFQPPPYCLEPPAYYDVIGEAPQYDVTSSTRGSAVVY